MQADSLVSLLQEAMSDHNEWRRTQGLQPLPSKSKRLLAEQAANEPPSDQSDLPAPGSDSLESVLTHLAFADDDSSDSEEEEYPSDDGEALAEEVSGAVVGGAEASDELVQLQASGGINNTPVDGVAGQYLYYGYVSPFAFAEPAKNSDGVKSSIPCATVIR